jgi:SPP1 gp7 family putative phage head morphogenesis protein
MAISSNPTKTRGIEKAWNREINRRFGEFTKSVIGEIRALNRLVVNEFDLNPDQLRAYMLFFQRELDRLIVGSWQEKYQARSYQLAIDRTNQELKRQGVNLTAREGGAALTSVELGAVVASFDALSPNIFNPVHQEALAFLFTRSFEALSGMSQEMARNVRNILFNGAQQGIGINELTRQIAERISVGRSRARLIAQTETIQAFQRGTINQANLASEFLGEDVKLRWLTRRDNKVRHLHAGWHGKVFTRENAFKNINISPWNCRCGLSPVIKEADTEVKRDKFTKERKQLIDLTNT